MFKSATRVWGIVLAGTMVGLIGCAGVPGGAPVPTTATGTMEMGLAGSGYAVASLNTAAKPGQPAYSTVMFMPDEIKIHYAGPIPANEEIPEEIAGEEAPVADEQAAQAGEENAIPEDGWITFKIKDGFEPVDLMKLNGSSHAFTFGETALPAGRYDQIRLVAGKPGSPASQNPLGWTGIQDAVEVSGKYFLPSNRLHINQGLEIREGYKTDLKFSFDAQAAMVQAGDKTILKPAAVKVFATYEPIVEASPSPEPSESPNPEPSEAPEA